MESVMTNKNDMGIAIIYDKEWSGNLSSSVYNLASEMQGDKTIECISSCVENLGFRKPKILSSKQLAMLALGEISNLFEGVINLASGIADNFRSGQAPILLEILDIDYSGNDPEATLYCRNKYKSKKFAEQLGIPTPSGGVFNDKTRHLIFDLNDNVFPAMVKPNSSSTSIGISSKAASDHKSAVNSFELLSAEVDDSILVEKFIRGQEVTVLVLGSDSELESIALLAHSENWTKDTVIDYEAKQKQNINWLPATRRLEESVVAKCKRYSELFVKELGLRDFNRVDFRITEDNEIYFIECNAQPLLSPKSSYVQAANLLLNDELGLQRKFVNTAFKRMKLI